MNFTIPLKVASAMSVEYGRTYPKKRRSERALVGAGVDVPSSGPSRP
jgi:hypothetical protein